MVLIWYGMLYFIQQYYVGFFIFSMLYIKYTLKAFKDLKNKQQKCMK